ncbi:unnamed protein product, partial [Symbiodinium sp. CCMP2456]
MPTKSAACWIAAAGLTAVSGHWGWKQTDFTPAPDMQLDPPQTLSEARFQCSFAPQHSERACFGPAHGGCPNGTKCFIKDNPRTAEIYAACCCNRTTTPIDMVYREHWSCFATELTSEQSHGFLPHCDILCCERPKVARACHGNAPICCDEEVTDCGISLEGNACCAPKDPSVRTHCCAIRGATCWYHRSWLK